MIQVGENTETQTEFIYALVDPRSDLPFYIGRSSNPHSRFSAHMRRSSATPMVAARIAEIRAEGLEPSLSYLEETKEGRRAECEWVQRCRAEGVDLVNSFRRNSYDPDKKPNPNPDTRKSLTLKLPEPLYERLREYAFENRMTHQAVIYEALMLYLHEHPE